jgi:hypothetical protein
MTAERDGLLLLKESWSLSSVAVLGARVPCPGEGEYHEEAKAQEGKVGH